MLESYGLEPWQSDAGLLGRYSKGALRANFWVTYNGSIGEL